jgi:hypothetical protein
MFIARLQQNVCRKIVDRASPARQPLAWSIVRPDLIIHQAGAMMHRR